MATFLSDLMTNLLAKPSVPNDAGLWHGRVYCDIAETAVAAADSDGHIYPVTRLPHEARILRVGVFNSAITVGTDYDLGIYESGDWAAADQTVKDADVLAGDVTMATARDPGVSPWNVLGEGTGPTNPSIGKALWELAGDTTKPQPATSYDVCWTANTVGSAAGTIRTVILYTLGH